MQCSSFYNMIHQNLNMHNNFIFAGWTVFNSKFNIFDILLNVRLAHESCLASYRPLVGKTERNGKRRYSKRGRLGSGQVITHSTQNLPRIFFAPLLPRWGLV